ncbi:hypothetical protein F4774DRAFT_368887, partial [Daldinia eschscholtzii]
MYAYSPYNPHNPYNPVPIHTHMLPVEVPEVHVALFMVAFANQSIPSHHRDAGGFANSSSHQMWSHVEFRNRRLRFPIAMQCSSRADKAHKMKGKRNTV